MQCVRNEKARRLAFDMVDVLGLLPHVFLSFLSLHKQQTKPVDCFPFYIVSKVSSIDPGPDRSLRSDRDSWQWRMKIFIPQRLAISMHNKLGK